MQECAGVPGHYRGGGEDGRSGHLRQGKANDFVTVTPLMFLTSINVKWKEKH